MEINGRTWHVHVPTAADFLLLRIHERDGPAAATTAGSPGPRPAQRDGPRASTARRSRWACTRRATATRRCGPTTPPTPSTRCTTALVGPRRGPTACLSLRYATLPTIAPAHVTQINYPCRLRPLLQLPIAPEAYLSNTLEVAKPVELVGTGTLSTNKVQDPTLPHGPLLRVVRPGDAPPLITGHSHCFSPHCFASSGRGFTAATRPKSATRGPT